MRAIQKILCATDFSEGSDVAVSAAVDLARRLSAKVDLVHVMQVPIYVGWEESAAGLAATAQVIAEIRTSVQQQLDNTAKRFEGSGVEFSVHVYEGTPHQKLAELSQAVDLVVVGTHGRTGLQHLLLGSTAERVVRTSSCPVLTVPLPRPAK